MVSLLYFRPNNFLRVLTYVSRVVDIVISNVFNLNKHYLFLFFLVVFPVASWDVCPVCIGESRIEVCYCCAYVGNLNELQERNCCFVCSMNDGQFALL